MVRRLSIAALSALLALLVSCAQAPPPATPSESFAYRAMLVWNQGDYYGAWNLYRRSYDRAVMYGDLQGQAFSLLNMAELAAQAMKYSAADSLLSAVPVELLSQEEIALERETILFRLMAGRGECDAASSEPSEKVAGSSAARWYLASARCALVNDDIQAARHALERATELFGKEGAGQLLQARAALASASGEQAEAIRLLEGALVRAQEARLPRVIGELLYNLGAAHESQGDRTSAARHYDRSAKLFYQLRLAYPRIKALQGWLRVTESPSEEQRALFDELCKKHAGTDLDAVLANLRF